MEEPTQTGQEPQPQTPPEGGAQDGAAASTTQGAGNAGSGKEAAAADNVRGQQVFDAGYVTALRAEAAEYRIKHKAVQEALEKANQELARLSEQNRRNAIQIAIQTAQTRVVDADAAMRLLDEKRIEFAEDGRPKNIDELLRELVEARPYLAAATTAVSTPAANPARSGTARLTPEQIAQMTPAEINANWEAVKETLKGA